jgi:hypothetical protein
LVGIERRDDQYAHGRVVLDQLASGGDTVESGHANVHQHEVWTVAPDGYLSLLAICGLADNLDVSLAVQDEAEAGADHRLVVDNEDADHTAS